MIRSAFNGMAGVEHLEFNLIGRTLTVVHEPGMEPAIISTVASLGMEAVPRLERPLRLELPVIEPSFWRQPLTIAIIMAGVCAVAAEVLDIVAGGGLAARAVALIAIVAAGYPIAPKAYHAVRQLSLNIHFLMALAVLGAVAIDQWSEAAMVVFLFAVAELVEARSLNRARSAIRALMQLTPPVARVLREGVAVDVPADDVAIGAVVRVRPGERLALDGIVTAGYSAVNQAPITGESIPVEKEPGQEVFAGSINGHGTFDYQVTHTAADSTLARIAQIVEGATANRGRTERFVDRFSRYYTPAIFAIAVLVAVIPPLLAGAVWDTWIYNGLVLLVIGCPCALVISTPVTIVSGLAAAARRGILIKGGEFLERGRELRTIAFDKTGTLTESRLRVTDVVPFDGIEPDELVHLAAAIEGKSEHPIAAAIVAEHELIHAGEQETEIAGFQALPGRGAAASVDGRSIWVGNHRLVHDIGVCGAHVEEVLAGLESQGKTTVVVMNADTVLGVIAVADTVRASSAPAVARLHALGIGTAILTGDNATTAAGVAGPLAIGSVYAELLPADKLAVLDQLEQDHNGPVGMVGEGVNDVPALHRASIGFVMGAAGSDAALEAADVALMDDDLRKIPEFIESSHHTLGVLRQNITIALVLKGIFFVLAVFGKATLWMAVFADMGASLIVVANGLRLLKSRPRAKGNADEG